MDTTPKVGTGTETTPNMDTILKMGMGTPNMDTTPKVGTPKVGTPKVVIRTATTDHTAQILLKLTKRTIKLFC